MGDDCTLLASVNNGGEKKIKRINGQQISWDEIDTKKNRILANNNNTKINDNTVSYYL